MTIISSKRINGTEVLGHIKSKNVKKGLRHLNTLRYHHSGTGFVILRSLFGVLNVSCRST